MYAPDRGPSRRTVVAATALAGAAAAVGAPEAALAAANAPATEAVLRSHDLDVRVDTGFPRIVSYTDRGTGAVLYGQENPVTSVLIDSVARTPRVAARARRDRIAYTLAFGRRHRDDVEIRVEGRQVHWRVTRIADTAALRVGTLEIPGLALLSVRSDQPGATLLAARIAAGQGGQRRHADHPRP